jgi:glutamyl-tRNA synthetase
LLAQWFVAPPARRATRGERAATAAWYPREADRRTEVHERLRAARIEVFASTFPNARDVGVDRQDAATEGEAGHRVCRIATDPRQLGQVVRPPGCGDPRRGPVQVQRPAVVAQPLPGANRFRGRHGGERLHGRPALEPGEVSRHDTIDLGLLEHHLGDEDRVWIARPAPGQVAAVRGEPDEQRLTHGRDSNFRLGMRKVRFAPSPTGSLHVGNALSAVANRAFGDWMLLRIDDTDPERNVPAGEDAILADLAWLGVDWDEGPVRQSERSARYAEAGRQVGDRFEGITLLREDGTATYHLASVVDDVDFGITHVLRGNDHRPNEHLHRRLAEALGAKPPEYVHHGLILGEDGRKLSKRTPGATVASLRDQGIPAAAVRRYLEELGLPKHDVHYDLPRIRRLAIEAIAEMPDEELGEAADAPVELVPVLRGARDLNEARELARQVLEPEAAKLPSDARLTLERFKELRERASNGLDHDAARELVRELKAVGGNLKTLRLALTGRDRGPELAALLVALPKDETLRRVDAAL